MGKLLIGLSKPLQIYEQGAADGRKAAEAQRATPAEAYARDQWLYDRGYRDALRRVRDLLGISAVCKMTGADAESKKYIHRLLDIQGE